MSEGQIKCSNIHALEAFLKNEANCQFKICTSVSLVEQNIHYLCKVGNQSANHLTEMSDKRADSFHEHPINIPLWTSSEAYQVAYLTGTSH